MQVKWDVSGHTAIQTAMLQTAMRGKYIPHHIYHRTHMVTWHGWTLWSDDLFGLLYVIRK